MRKRPRGRRPARASIVLRWLAVGVTLLVALLYYRPLRSYLETRDALEGRKAEVRALQVEQHRLQRRVEVSTSAEALLVEARKLGFVKEGERLFIVKGIPAWRAAKRRTIGGDGRP